MTTKSKLKKRWNKDWYKQVVESVPAQKTVSWAKTHYLPGSKSVPLFDIVVFIYNETKRFDLFTRANAISYSFFLALFPALMALFTLLPFIKHYFIGYLPGGEQFDLVLENSVRQILPGIAGDRVFEFINSVINEPRYDLLSFGFILALYFASNGMLALMNGFDKSSYDKTFKRRTGIKKRGIAIMLTLEIGVLLIASVTFIILGDYIVSLLIEYTRLDIVSQYLVQLVRWLSIILLFFVGIGTIYRHGAATWRKFPLNSPGTIVAALLCLLSSLAFSKYVNQFSTYNQLYGSIGAIIVLMLWIQLTTLSLLIGFELNASIAVNKDLKKAIPDKDVIPSAKTSEVPPPEIVLETTPPPSENETKPTPPGI